MFSANFGKNILIQNLMKIRPVVADLFNAQGRSDGQIEMTKLIVAFHNFAKAPNIALTFQRPLHISFADSFTDSTNGNWFRRSNVWIWDKYERFNMLPLYTLRQLIKRSLKSLDVIFVANLLAVFNPLKTKRRLLYLKIQFVPRSKHFSYRL